MIAVGGHSSWQVLDHGALPLFTPAVAGERAVTSEDAMAGYREGTGDVSASFCYGAG
jgi:hypothetical protein